MSPHSLSRNSLLQPRTYEVPTTPNPEQTYWTMVQQSGQSGPYNEFQLATDDATGRDGRHNDNTVSRPTGQYPNFPSMQHLLPSAIGGTSEHVDPPSRSSGPFMDDRMNRPRTTNTNEYDDRTHFSQPDHYPSFAPQVDPRQPSHIFSSGEPWSSHNLVSDRSFSTMKPTAIDDRRRLGDSDAYSSEQTGSQIFSNASSDWDRSTTDSSVEPLTNDMSDSIATIRASDQIASSQEMLHTDMFEHHPSSVRTASSMSRSLHGGYDRTLQDIEPPTRSQNSRTGSGTRPILSAYSTSYLEVSQQQQQQQQYQQVDSVYSTPASALSPSLPGTIVCFCPVCSKKYTGQYQKGNLSRHIRLKHGSLERVYSCEAQDCTKNFKRQDARLKHYRNRHPGLRHGPALLRKAHRRSELIEHDLRGIS